MDTVRLLPSILVCGKPLENGFGTVKNACGPDGRHEDSGVWSAAAYVARAGYGRELFLRLGYGFVQTQGGVQEKREISITEALTTIIKATPLSTQTALFPAGRRTDRLPGKGR